MQVFGWIIFIFGGAAFVGKTGTTLALIVLRGGLEAIPPALVVGALSAIVWLAVTLYLSPFGITFH
jgi:hypothetical protein